MEVALNEDAPEKKRIVCERLGHEVCETRKRKIEIRHRRALDKPFVEGVPPETLVRLDCGNYPEDKRVGVAWQTFGSRHRSHAD